VQGDLFLASARPDASRTGVERDPGAASDLGEGIRGDGVARLHRIRSDLREQGRDDGLLKPSSALSDVGHHSLAHGHRTRAKRSSRIQKKQTQAATELILIYGNNNNIIINISFIINIV